MDELDKYEKAKQQKEHKKSKAFVYQDLSRLKIYTLAILFLSASNLLFTLFIMHYYKLQNITTYYFPVAMVTLLLVSIFGQISVIRVEQKHEKYYFNNMSGTFNFEALMFYFRLNMIGFPVVLYQTASILLNF